VFQTFANTEALLKYFPRENEPGGREHRENFATFFELLGAPLLLATWSGSKSAIYERK
jgi:hypothetical protein